MEIPTIAPEDIAHFHTLFADFKSPQEQAGAAIDLAKLNKETRSPLKREDRLSVPAEARNSKIHYVSFAVLRLNCCRNPLLP